MSIKNTLLNYLITNELMHFLSFLLLKIAIGVFSTANCCEKASALFSNSLMNLLLSKP